MVRRAMLAAIAVALVVPAGASACSIAALNPYQRVKLSDAAIYGRVLGVRWLGPGRFAPPDKRYAFRVRVLRVFKGHPDRVVRLVGHTQGSSCGEHAPKPGQKIGLLLGRPPYSYGLGTDISLADLELAQRGPPPPARPPRIDPRVGSPAYLATVEVSAATTQDYAILLDAHGRVARHLGRKPDNVAVCPGGRRIVETWDFDGRILTRSWSRVVARRTTPLYVFQGLTCLDENASSVALVTQCADCNDDTSTLRLYSPTDGRAVLRFDGGTSLLDASGLYEPDATGVTVHDLDSGAVRRRVTLPDWATSVLPSPPDGRYWAVTLEPRDLNHYQAIVDTQTGQVTRIADDPLGWTAPNRLAVFARHGMEVLDLAGHAVSAPSAFNPTSAVVSSDGRVVGVARRRLLELPPGAGAARFVGTVPPGTTLTASLR